MNRYGPAPLQSASRALLHLLAIVAGWALFVWGWFDVAARPWHTRELWLLIIGALLVLPGLTLAWILHNLALYRRKGPRRAVTQADLPYDRDWAGRRVEADWRSLAGAAWIEIDADDQRKRFRTLDVAPHRRAAAHAAPTATDRPFEVPKQRLAGRP